MATLELMPGSKWFIRALVLCLLASVTPAYAAQIDITCPSSCSSFGAVTVLPNGNIVVVDASGFDNKGAAYLYSPTGVLISTLTGSNSGDQVGSGGVVVLANGNFVVVSYLWNSYRGAVTWVSGSSGLSAEVSASNSLVGSVPIGAGSNGDRVGYGGGVTALSNGNYVVASTYWNNGAATQAGAVTLGNGTTGTAGLVSTANSLVGSTTNDWVGISVTALTNGNYVVDSWAWSSDTAAGVGAVTWANGNTGVTGAVSPSNSLVGTNIGDQVGGQGIIPLNNGNYVVQSGLWNLNGSPPYLCAVTWGNGTTGATGPVSPRNSLVGTGPSNGLGRTIALSNGNYVVTSLYDNGVGAVTWADGTNGATGVISASNSLVGTTPNDLVGCCGDFSGGYGGGITALNNGNYVVASPFWSDGAATQVGAVTLVDGTTGMIGEVSTSNSLTGSTASEEVGIVLTALSNGNYVVSSYYNSGAGAETWGDGTTGVTGSVSGSNSLVGSGGIVTALTNGNYVVAYPHWSNGAATQVGLATWVDGTAASSGVIASLDSLVGSTTNDQVGAFTVSGESGVTALNNGNYVVVSDGWSNGSATGAGAVTWANGVTGLSGVVSTTNSLVGTGTGDAVGADGAIAQNDGNYVIVSHHWNDGAGAITLASGGFRLVGTIQAWNSVIGSSPTGGNQMVFAYDATRHQLIVGRPADNIVSLFTMDQVFSGGFEQ
jgi:hypothetical protein